MLRILVVGGYSDREYEEEMTAFGRALGQEIIRQGHVLVSANRVDFDEIVAEGARGVCNESAIECDSRILSYVMKYQGKPRFSFGRVIRSQETSWDPGKRKTPRAPGPFRRADAVVLVKGGRTTNRAAFWARSRGCPLLPVAYFEGTAERIYLQELDRFDERYADWVEKLDYEALSELSSNWNGQAAKLVNLAEKLVVSSSVVVSMSYSSDRETSTALDNTFKSIGFVCKDYGYVAQKVSERNVGRGERILPAILRRIEQSGFVVLDLTDLSPNVIHEVGFVQGKQKEHLLTARKGTVLPFNLKDEPVLFWDPIDQDGLRRRLDEKIRDIATRQGRDPNG